MRGLAAPDTVLPCPDPGDWAAALADRVLALAGVPPAPAVLQPVFHLTVPERSVTLNVPEREVQVHVAAAEPAVVNLGDTVVNVESPKPVKTKTTLLKDDAGKVVGKLEEPEEAHDPQ